MYDGSVYKVFTGVIVRVVPNAAHFEMHFVPLNETRNALVRDEKGEPLVWVVQMESAAQASKDGITRESFPQGAVMSMGVHPRRDGKPAGDRGDSGLFQCPKGKAPAARQALRFRGRQSDLRGRRSPAGRPAATAGQARGLRPGDRRTTTGRTRGLAGRTRGLE